MGIKWENGYKRGYKMITLFRNGLSENPFNPWFSSFFIKYEMGTSVKNGITIKTYQCRLIVVLSTYWSESQKMKTCRLTELGDYLNG